MSTQLSFHNVQLSTINRNGQIWLTSSELAKALQYKSDKSVTNIFNSNSYEFTGCMTTVIDSVTVTGMRYKTRTFSLRGCHLIAMFSRTNVAKEFRIWVLDILDKESGGIVKNTYLTHAEQQALIRAINECVARTGEHSELISQRLCEKFNVNGRSELKTSQLDEAYAFLRSLTKKEIIGKRYVVEVKITDHMLNGQKIIIGSCNNFNALLNGLAQNLGYQIDKLSLNEKTLSI